MSIENSSSYVGIAHGIRRPALPNRPQSQLAFVGTNPTGELIPFAGFGPANSHRGTEHTL